MFTYSTHRIPFLPSAPPLPANPVPPMSERPLLVGRYSLVLTHRCVEFFCHTPLIPAHSRPHLSPALGDHYTAPVPSESTVRISSTLRCKIRLPLPESDRRPRASSVHPLVSSHLFAFSLPSSQNLPSPWNISSPLPCLLLLRSPVSIPFHDFFSPRPPDALMSEISSPFVTGLSRVSFGNAQRSSPLSPPTARACEAHSAALPPPQPAPRAPAPVRCCGIVDCTRK